MDLKHKDAPPQQTIERIREILKSVGTEPTLRLLKNTDNIYSASLYDTACGWRVNGKGTSEEYCIASAYGEAMERLQAYFIYERSDKNDPAAADDFLMYPDEQKCETSRVKQDYPFIYEDLRTMFAMECGCRTDEVSEKELDEFLSVYFRDTTYSKLLAEDYHYVTEALEARISALSAKPIVVDETIYGTSTVDVRGTSTEPMLAVNAELEEIVGNLKKAEALNADMTDGVISRKNSIKN